jgi:hypothetical protein
MAFVTTLLVLTMTGSGETVFQATGGFKFVADCKVNPVALAAQDKTTLVPN